MTQRIFITGGASGLGRAMAEIYVRNGDKVCIADIDDEAGAETFTQLQSMGGSAHYVHCDVRQEDDFASAASWLKNNWGGVDIIINNAGVAQMGPIDKTSIEDWQWIIDINILSIAKSSRVFVPMLKKQGHGRIVNIASMAGLLHMPNASAYNATKAAVVAISETMLLELEDFGIDISVVCPAFFRTNLAKNMRASDPEQERVTKRLVERSRIGVEEISKAVVDGITKGDIHIFTHPQARQAWMMKRYLPFGMFLNKIRKQMKKLDERMARPEKDQS
ncbi:SDR family oxidoreductase [Amylibacter sp. SFDW26]|uniref:SDR family oxidoreductase n=1 Tax=Amylibacter sp. SFDW26 TaxID=2652722 RepID=UPI0012617D53|nr:SDR family oxidoreductase [Amylibacter sp. SFDW26]KAB7613373.1 SDR family oxidoreductase [Amylibacter sp. SFDW26]